MVQQIAILNFLGDMQAVEKTMFSINGKVMPFSVLMENLEERPNLLFTLASNSSKKVDLRVVYPFAIIIDGGSDNEDSYWEYDKVTNSIKDASDTRDRAYVNLITGEREEFHKLINMEGSIPVYNKRIWNEMKEEIAKAINSQSSEGEEPKMTVSHDMHFVEKKPPFEKGFVKAGTVLPFSMVEECFFSDDESLVNDAKKTLVNNFNKYNKINKDGEQRTNHRTETSNGKHNY